MSMLLDRMRAIMEKEGIKPKQLTEEFGISNSSFTDWGKGKGTPSVAVLAKFSDRFNVSIDYLVRGDEVNLPCLEFSNASGQESVFTANSLPLQDQELLDKFHSLPPEYQSKLIGYIDGMLTILQEQKKKIHDKKASES